MAAIATEQGQYKTYVLTDEAANSQIQVVPERGGIVTQWQMDGQELLYLDNERFKDPSLSVRGGIPLLFPICGNLVNDTYTLNGQTYTQPQHGFARTLPWQVTSQSTENGASLTVTLESSPEIQANYPFDFALNYTYTLQGNALTLRFGHTNRSDRPMPFSTGIHPYFAVGDKSQLSFEIPAEQYKIKGGSEVYPFSGAFDFSQDEIDYAFIDLKGQQAIATDARRGLKLTIAYDQHYSTLVFWTVKGKDFYCVEPWSGPRNAINTGAHVLTAAPGETVETQITMAAELG